MPLVLKHWKKTEIGKNRYSILSTSWYWLVVLLLSITFLIAVTRYVTRSDLRKDGSTPAHDSKVQSIMPWKVQRQEQVPTVLVGICYICVNKEPEKIEYHGRCSTVFFCSSFHSVVILSPWDIFTYIQNMY